MAYLGRLERPTCGLEDRCSIQLSYRYCWFDAVCLSSRDSQALSKLTFRWLNNTHGNLLARNGVYAVLTLLPLWNLLLMH